MKESAKGRFFENKKNSIMEIIFSPSGLDIRKYFQLGIGFGPLLEVDRVLISMTMTMTMARLTSND